MTALIPLVKFSRKSQKHKKATPRFQLCLTKLVKRTRSNIAAVRMHAMGYSGYVGSIAPGMLEIAMQWRL